MPVAMKYGHSTDAVTPIADQFQVLIKRFSQRHHGMFVTLPDAHRWGIEQPAIDAVLMMQPR